MSYRHLIGAFALVCAATPALAQTTPTPGTDTPAARTGADAGMASGMDAGMKMADTATVKVKYATVKPADVMSSKLVGANVINNQNETVGQVEDLVIENGKTLNAIVVSVGGFLGLGESYVALDPSTLTVSNKDGTWAVHADTNKDTLKNAPKFEYSKKK